MFLFRLSSHAFKRVYPPYGYITSSLTKHDRVYDANGCVFLQTLSREPKHFEEGLNYLFSIFKTASADEVRCDYKEFLEDLARDKFIVIGSSTLELDSKELRFSYSLTDPKTMGFLNAVPKGIKETTTFFSDYFRKCPQIFGFQIELTNRCNERCIHCYIPHKNKQLDLEFNLAIDVIDQLAEMGTVTLTISGGECFLHPNFFEILAHAKKKDFCLSILSNATLITSENVRFIRDLNLSVFQVSVYSLAPTIHDSITQVSGSLAHTLANIDLLIENNIPVQISCPVMQSNRLGYKDVVSWANKKKMKANTDFILMARSDGSTENLNQRIGVDETKLLVQDILETDKDYLNALNQIQPKSRDIEEYSHKPVCGAGVDSLCVAADGGLYPCSGWQSYLVGNVKTSPIKQVWEESPRLKQLRAITNADFPDCLKCDSIDYCSMCLVRNFNESGGDMFAINRHFCKVAKANKEIVEGFLRGKNR